MTCSVSYVFLVVFFNGENTERERKKTEDFKMLRAFLSVYRRRGLEAKNVISRLCQMEENFCSPFRKGMKEVQM